MMSVGIILLLLQTKGQSHRLCDRNFVKICVKDLCHTSESLLLKLFDVMLILLQDECRSVGAILLLEQKKWSRSQA